MTIPKSYEALAADLASEKILSKTLLGQKEAYMMLADKGGRDLIESKTGEPALREGLTTARRDFDYDRGFSAGSAEVETFRIERDALQQRLIVAEQRLSQVEGACDLAMSAIDDDERGANFVKIIQAIKDKAALKPAAEVAAYCTHPPGYKQCSWCGFKAESKLAAEGEGS